MQHILPILLLFIGIGLGAIAAWVLLSAKIRHEFERGRSESGAQAAAQAERLAAREETIEELRNRLQEKEVTVEQRQCRITELNAKAAQLETSLAEQRKQAEEKLVLLEDAKKQLSDAFKALAADALESSNTSFLQLAKSQLEKFQEMAKGDLSKRQTAIDELVKPVRESLGKVDAKLQEI